MFIPPDDELPPLTDEDLAEMHISRGIGAVMAGLNIQRNQDRQSTAA